MKLHVHDLEKHLHDEISAVEKMAKDGDFIGSQKEQETRLAELGQESRNLGRFIPKIEKMEVDLDLLEKEGKGIPKDEDLVNVVSGITQAVQKEKVSLADMRKKQKEDAKDAEKQAEDAQYAFVPKQAFDWDSLSTEVNEIM